MLTRRETRGVMPGVRHLRRDADDAGYHTPVSRGLVRLTPMGGAALGRWSGVAAAWI